jgi:hypothetical protein
VSKGLQACRDVATRGGLLGALEKGGEEEWDFPLRNVVSDLDIRLCKLESRSGRLTKRERTVDSSLCSMIPLIFQKPITPAHSRRYQQSGST